jgi:selenide,water dikinase
MPVAVTPFAMSGFEGNGRRHYDSPAMTRLEMPPARIRLTELTDCGGCAAKLGADLLADALAGLGATGEDPPELLAGLDSPDDAAAYRLSDELAVIGTVDFFPPLVDDPRTFGGIAAANAVSDVYAMGGRVLFALSIAAFPEELPRATMAEILGGAASVVREAGGALAGGHTIRDPEPKYGLAVIGVAHPDRLLRKGGARPGDRLLLTKPLGTGLVVSGRRRGLTSDEDLAGAIASMRRLNGSASAALVGHGVVAATDVTGFGLLGHAAEMARASELAGSPVRLVIEADLLPSLPGALALARAGVETDGAAHNRRSVVGRVSIESAVRADLEALAFDPQTSGGLLAAVPAEQADDVGGALAAGGIDHAWIGAVEEGSGVVLR